MNIRAYVLSFLVLAVGPLSGCSTNPVTGETELSLISIEREIEVGRENYLPYRQANGGDYVADPGVQRYVQQVGERLAAVSDRPLPFEFVVINDSTPNAWALPGGKIAVNRGLLVEMRSEAELAAVLAHEIVHAAAGHGADGMERDLLLGGALALGRIALAGRDHGGAVLAGAQIGAGLFARSYGRDAEREADHYGIRYMRRAGYDPREAIALQQTFVRLARGRDPGWLAGLFASHPPSQERVENNRRSVAELSAAGGEIGRERHRRAIARLLHGREAYASYDRAVELFREVARADSPVAEDALMHLARLDLPDNPDRYVDASITLGADGYLRVIVDNDTPVDVAGLRVAVGARRVLGMRVRGEYDVDGAVPARERVSLRTDLGPFDADKARHYVARVVQARVVD